MLTRYQTGGCGVAISALGFVAGILFGNGIRIRNFCAAALIAAALGVLLIGLFSRRLSARSVGEIESQPPYGTSGLL
jgi:hypothetical protein